VTLNGFDRIALVYDLLARLVFGRSIINSQKFFLNKIEDHHNVLILGGGSGWLLAELLTIKPECKVWYIEASEKMIDLSQKKVDSKSSIHFIHGTEADIPSSIKYDVVISNFYLDLFTDEQLTDVTHKIISSLSPGSQWIATDFVERNKGWQKLLLKLMYYFFRIICHIGSRKLPQWNKAILASGIKKIESRLFYDGFIETALYQR
jgi:tRNA (cmo5U34)-methyltransferase